MGNYHKNTRGDRTRAIEILQNGENLIIKQQNNKGNIKEITGTIKGNTLQWSSSRSRNDKLVTLLYKGTVTGDTMTGEFQVGKRKARPWTGRRLSDR